MARRVVSCVMQSDQLSGNKEGVTHLVVKYLHSLSQVCRIFVVHISQSHCAMSSAYPSQEKPHNSRELHQYCGGNVDDHEVSVVTTPLASARAVRERVEGMRACLADKSPRRLAAGFLVTPRVFGGLTGTACAFTAEVFLAPCAALRSFTSAFLTTAGAFAAAFDAGAGRGVGSNSTICE
jgi:hypothetical protein